jgi:myo-inositol-1(or 4)-monophosphatase
VQFAKKLLTSTELRAKVEVKEDGTLVTGLDRKVEALFRRSIGRSVFKGDQIVSEAAQGEFDPGNGSCWVIDPLDGAHNYVNDRLPYAVSIGYVLNNEPVFGVVVKPGLRGFSIVSALKGCGVEVDGLPFSPGTPITPVAGLDFKNTEEDKLTRVVGALHERYKEVRVLGSIVTGLTEVGLGSLSFYAHFAPRTWDVAAALAILREAGKVTNVDDFDLAKLAANGHRLRFTIAAQDEDVLGEAASLIWETIKDLGEVKVLANLPFPQRRT